MITAMETETIKVRSIACQDALHDLVVGANSPPQSAIVDLREVENHQERFDQWAGNLGAFQDSESRLSLEYRLRNNAIIRDAILQLLADLRDSARSALSIVSGKQENRTALPLIEQEIDLAEFEVSSGSESTNLSSSDDNLPVLYVASEIQELTASIRGSIDGLFKTSIFIRKFGPRERRKRATEKADMVNSQADEMYIRDRYPAVERKGRDDLIVRLGTANAHRRQYFMYCRAHSDRLSHTNPTKDRRTVGNQVLGQQSRQEVVTIPGHRERSFLTTTEATDLIADNLSSRELPRFLQTDPSPSLVSFATTIDKSADNATAFPPLPSDARSNSLFLCPYCQNIVKLNPQDKEQHWRKHVLSDLEPYVCTHPGCSLDTFQSQHAWFDHELLIHRGTWPCFRCGEVAGAAEALRNHIKTQHADLVSPQQLSMVVEQSRRPVKFIQPSECPFCDDEWAALELNSEGTDSGALVVTPDDFRRHVGQHLQHIALFSLPRLGQNQEARSSAVTGGTTDRSLCSITSPSLRDQIMEELVVSAFPPGSHQVYMPAGHLDRLITEESIIGELTGMLKLDPGEQSYTHVDEGLIEYILKSAKKVFAISLICDIEAGELHKAMEIFKSADFDDGKVPVKFTDSGEAPWSQLQWPALITHKFRQRQWMFLVPIFRRGILNVELEPHHILPFALAPNNKANSRTHSLWEVTVHEAHQEEPMRRFDNTLATAAIRACETETASAKAEANEKQQNEHEFLEDIRKLRHSHIVETEAIITWAGRGRYFMYKWPDGGTLRDFYASDPRPSLDGGFVHEVIQQLAGLVDAIRKLNDQKASGGRMYRHGNLKPEGIWRYEDGSRVGVMKLGGIAWENDRLQRDSIHDRLSYDPPEATFDPNSAWSQRHDMWSMGCIIMELIMCLLYGTDKLESFIRSMNESSKSRVPYWVVEKDETRRWAQVHPYVRTCMDDMEEHSECSEAHATAIGDLLTTVRTRLLVVPLPSITVPQSQGRADSSEILNGLRGMLEKGRSNSRYWYTGVPRDDLAGPAGPEESIPAIRMQPSS